MASSTKEAAGQVIQQVIQLRNELMIHAPHDGFVKEDVDKLDDAIDILVTLTPIREQRRQALDELMKLSEGNPID